MRIPSPHRFAVAILLTSFAPSIATCSTVPITFEYQPQTEDRTVEITRLYTLTDSAHSKLSHVKMFIPRSSRTDHYQVEDNDSIKQWIESIPPGAEIRYSPMLVDSFWNSKDCRRPGIQIIWSREAMLEYLSMDMPKPIGMRVIQGSQIRWVYNPENIDFPESLPLSEIRRDTEHFAYARIEYADTSAENTARRTMDDARGDVIRYIDDIMCAILDRVSFSLDGAKTAYEAWDTGIASCQGYTNLFIGFLDYWGIPARAVYGELMPAEGEEYGMHSWPEARVGVGNTWVPFDPQLSSFYISPNVYAYSVAPVAHSKIVQDVLLYRYTKGTLEQHGAIQITNQYNYPDVDSIEVGEALSSCPDSNLTRWAPRGLQ